MVKTEEILTPLKLDLELQRDLNAMKKKFMNLYSDFYEHLDIDIEVNFRINNFFNKTYKSYKKKEL